MSIALRSPVVPVKYTLDIIEAESDGGQTAISFGTAQGTATGKLLGKLLKVPDPPNAEHVFAGNAFHCPYCYSLIIVENSKGWQYVSMSQSQAPQKACN